MNNNCFYCSGLNRVCDLYFEGDRERCLWREIADHDLTKAQDGKMDKLVLVDQFYEYAFKRGHERNKE